jgi:hypothetical protein
MLTLTCQSCGSPITGETLDELTANVQVHVRQHGHSRPIRPEHVQARLRKESGGEQQPGNNGHEHP